MTAKSKTLTTLPVRKSRLSNIGRGHGIVLVLGQRFMCAWVTIETRTSMYDLRTWPGDKDPQKMRNMRPLVLPGEIQRWWKGPSITKLQEAHALVADDLKKFCNSEGKDMETWERLTQRIGQFNKETE